jgi:serine-type D-Ala-D-Ala carboxypeptidase
LREPGALLSEAAADGVFSGAVLRVEDLAAGTPILEHVVGRSSSEPPGGAVRADSLFDLASLTKLITATGALRLVADGTLDLDDDVGALLGDDLHSGITVRHLLDHTSGLPAWAPLWRSGPVLDTALTTPREAPVGDRHKYSDIGFLVLMRVLEARTGKHLEALLTELVLAPFGMHATSWRGVGTPDRDVLQSGDVVATEHCPERGLLVGSASDRNTWHLGGVAPHAGLFGPAVDLASFAHCWWSAPSAGLLPEPLWQTIWQPPLHPGGHVLGWDTVAPDGYTSAGRELSSRSRGHLGFSGCSLWIDPDRAVAVVFLSNRIHPGRDDMRIRDLRPALHDAVARAVDAVR